MTDTYDVRDGYWTVECDDGCLGTGRYQQPNLPDYLDRCRTCRGTGRILITLAKETTP